ncbi:chloramphenicol-sensitive protein RarD [Pedobacter sp. CAN_A7]|uniref:EamA family transporter n=1 Tax=Pedobacter sp. CAN_A7 TaxID=2787722 RepID=UPI001A291F46
MMQKSTFKYYAAGIVAFVVWGGFAIPLKALSAYPSMQILEYRVFTALLLLAVIILTFGRANLKKDIKVFKTLSRTGRTKLGGLIFLSSILLMVNWFTFIYAVNNVSLTSAAFAYMVCPLLTALGGFFILKEKLTRVKLIGMAIAIFSILLLATGSLREVLWSIGIASVYAIYLIIQRFITQVNSLNMLGINLAISALFMLPYFFVNAAPIPDAVDFWLLILVVALVFTIVPLFLNLYALIELPSSTLGIIMYINPIIAFLIAFIHFKEPYHTNQLLAYSLLFVAVIVFNLGVFKGRNGQAKITS